MFVEGDAEGDNFIVHFDCALQHLLHPIALKFFSVMLEGRYLRPTSKIFTSTLFVLL